MLAKAKNDLDKEKKKKEELVAKTFEAKN